MEYFWNKSSTAQATELLHSSTYDLMDKQTAWVLFSTKKPTVWPTRTALVKERALSCLILAVVAVVIFLVSLSRKPLLLNARRVIATPSELTIFISAWESETIFKRVSGSWAERASAIAKAQWS